MKLSDFAKGAAVGAVLFALLFVLNRSLGADAALGADIKRSFGGAAIGAVAIAFYMPLRRRIKETIRSAK
ncbi:MAG: hypothetical protein AAFX08_04735 [Pseudomonadota bacterium]